MLTVLFRMALRNALRRRGQTAVVVLGLLIGTAIISGSLASGDSLSFGIKKAAYDALGPADALLETDGQLHFPRQLYDDLAADHSLPVVAFSPILYEEAALSNAETHQSEPRVSMIGIEPQLNRPFGIFHTTSGQVTDGSDLGSNDVYLLDSLAQKLNAHVGDTLAVHSTQAITPRIPRLFTFNGSLTASAGVCPLPQIPQSCQYVAPPGEPATFQLPVAPGAVSVTTIVTWFGPNSAQTDLDQTLRAPDASVAFINSNGTPAAPDNPSVLNATLAKGSPTGNWTWEIRGKAAVNQPFRAIALVFYEEYNLTALQEFARQAQAAGFDANSLPGASAATGSAGGDTTNLTVRAIVKTDGFGGFLRGQNVFASYDTVARIYGVEGKTNIILASADADPVKGPSKTAPLMAAVPRAVNASASQHPDMPAIGAVKVLAVKERFLDASERAGTLFKEFLTTIGSFTVIAGIMLIVNIFVMLAEERKSELGMARAVGLQRRQLVTLFSLEGVLYAVVASAIGAFLGLLLAWGLILGFNQAFASGPADPGRQALTIPFHFEWSSVGWAFAAGFVITMVTVLIASWRISRLNVVRAIRRTEEPPRAASRALLVTGAVLLALGVAWSIFGFVSGDFPSKILAPCLAFIGAGIVASRFVRPTITYPIAGALVALYAGFTIFTFGNPRGLLNAVMGPIRGLFIVLAVVLILIHLPWLVRATSALLLKFRALIPAVRPGVGYPLRRRMRTGLTTTMFALVVLVVVAFSIFGATFAIDLQAQSGGYDVEGDTTVPIADLAAAAAQRDPGRPDPFARVAYHDDLRYAIAFGTNSVKINDQKPNYQGPPADYVYAYTTSFAQNNRYELLERSAGFPTDRAAYDAVLSRTDVVIISVAYTFDDQGNPGYHHVGETLTLQTPSGSANFTIIGIQKQLYLGGIFVNPKVLDSSFSRIRGEYLFKLKPGEDAKVAAQEIESAFEKQGMDANSIKEQAAQQLEQSRRFLTLFQLFLGFGLIVGIASLGIVTARNVIERRQEIGMLRAIGYPRRQVLRIFLIEIFFTTTMGIVVGVLIGVFTSYGVVVSTPSLASLGVKYTVPWLDLARILGLVYVAVFLATYWPARAGSNVPPAEAVRYIE